MKKITKQSRQQTKQLRNARALFHGHPEFKLDHFTTKVIKARLQWYQDLRRQGKTPEYPVYYPVINGYTSFY